MATSQASDRIMFPVALGDARLHPKRVIHGNEIDGPAVVCEQKCLEAMGQITDHVGDQQLSIRYQPDGSVQISNNAGSSWTAHRIGLPDILFTLIRCCGKRGCAA